MTLADAKALQKQAPWPFFWGAAITVFLLARVTLMLITICLESPQ